MSASRPPRLSVAAVLAGRRRLFEGLAEFAGCVPAGEDQERLVRRLQELLPTAQSVALWRTVQCLPPRELSEREVYELAWRLAGNEQRLTDGYMVGTWTAPGIEEWIPLQVLATRPHARQYRGQTLRGVQLRLQALAGTCCPERLEVWWSNKLVAFLSRRLGFTGPRSTRPRKHATELTLLRFWGLVDPKLSAQRPRFQTVSCPGVLRDYNIQILRQRRRLNWACPRQYLHECHQCPVGYLECSAATHPYTFVWKECQRCRQNGWHDVDPVWPAVVCVQCQPLEELRLRKGRK